MKRNIVLFLHIISLVLLYLGWTLNLLYIEVSTHFLVDIDLFKEKRSVIGTLESLWNSGNYWPFFLIFCFGILVPLVKSGLIFYVLLARNPHPGYSRFISAISKWAMADVFAISIFIAFLGANAMESTKAILEPGFYYFSAYVLLSAVISAMMTKMTTSPATSEG